jgi:hypothetical protein
VEASRSTQLPQTHARSPPSPSHLYACAKAFRPLVVLVINDNVMLYVTNVCFAETNCKLGRITGRCTTTVKTIPEIRT